MTSPATPPGSTPSASKPTSTRRRRSTARWSCRWCGPPTPTSSPATTRRSGSPPRSGCPAPSAITAGRDAPRTATRWSIGRCTRRRRASTSSSRSPPGSASGWRRPGRRPSGRPSRRRGAAPGGRPSRPAGSRWSCATGSSSWPTTTGRTPRRAGTWSGTRATGRVLGAVAPCRRSSGRAGPGWARRRRSAASAAGDRRRLTRRAPSDGRPARHPARQGVRRRAPGAPDLRPVGRFPTVDVAGSRLTLPVERRFASADSVQDYVDRVLALSWVRTQWPRAAVPVRVRERAGDAQAHYERDPAVIAVPGYRANAAWALRELVVLHELAHHLADCATDGGRAAARRRLRRPAAHPGRRHHRAGGGAAAPGHHAGVRRRGRVSGGPARPHRSVVRPHSRRRSPYRVSGRPTCP